MENYFKGWKNYANFSGRARRAEYWGFWLGNGLATGLLGLISDNLSGLYTLVAFVPLISCGVRRMHDVGKSGWFLLIPIYNFILAVTEGEKGSNEYGDDPKQL
jgi:uncharacterized membrane protein YhaH (DUF805 family)